MARPPAARRWELLRQRCPEVPADLWRARREICIVFIGRAAADRARRLDRRWPATRALRRPVRRQSVDMVIGAMTAPHARRLTGWPPWASDYEVPTTEELDAMYESLKNWGRWGADDQRGALNHLTDDRRAAAAGLVRRGRVDQPGPRPGHRAAARAPPSGPAPHAGLGRRPRLQRDPRLRGGPRPPGPRRPRPVDHPRRRPLPHVRPGRDVRRPAGQRGAQRRGPVQHRAVHGRRGRRPGRAPRHSPGPRASTSSTPARWSRSADLEAAEAAQGVRVGPGDVLLVAWGREARRAADPGVRRLLRAARRVPALAAGARGGRARAATGSPTRCRSSARRSGRSRCTRSASWPWGCT